MNQLGKITPGRSARGWARLHHGVGTVGSVLMVVGALLGLAALVCAFWSIPLAAVLLVPAVVLLVAGYKVFTALV